MTWKAVSARADEEAAIKTRLLHRSRNIRWNLETWEAYPNFTLTLM